MATVLYQATNTNVLAVLKQYLVLMQKEQWDDFPVQSAFCERLID